MNDLQVVQHMTAIEVVAQKRLIQEVMQAVMKEGVHYGTIPGCGDKPTLLKPGSDCILTTFKIAAMPEIEDLSSEDEVRYRLKVKGVHMTSDNVVGIGVGEASSSEDKYKWRSAACDEEWEDTPDDRRREKWKRGYGNKENYQVKQVRTNPADVANTVLKMAKKRAAVDLTLTATAASDCFAQDLEDLPEGVRENVAEETPLQEPKRKEPEKKKAGRPKGSKNGTISEAQRKRFFAIWKTAEKTEEQVKAYLKDTLNVESTKDIPKGDAYSAACQWAEKPIEEEVPFE